MLTDVNREIARNNPSLTVVTVFLGILDLNTGDLTYFSPNPIGNTVKPIVLRNDIQEMGRIVDGITQIADSVSCPPVVVHDVTLAVEEIF